MNAPLPNALLKALTHVSLDDKYALDEGRAFMSGVQALVKLPMLQRQRDLLAGKNTAGFISGYRGSPLGGYDQALEKAKPFLQENHIVFQPGVNEELAATALWGTQQLGFAPAGTQRYDGVFGIWYGKGPGVDRCSDVFKHANMAGTTPWGGVIAVAGDDHVAKSSTAAHQSDHIFKACGTPVFFPASVQDILDLGLHAFAMSRFSGVWAGMKTIQEIVESSATAFIDPHRVKIVLPTDFVMPKGGLHIRWPDTALEQEARLFDYKWYAALAYVRANRLNHNVIEGPHDRLGLIASGKAYNDTRQALLDLGLDDATCRQLGIRLHKVTVVWPLEAQLTREFAAGLQEILVIEEKRQVIEYQLKEELYNWRPDVRPNVLGKFNEVEGMGGEWSMPSPSANTLLRANADLSPALIAQAIAARLTKLGVPEDIRQRMKHHLAILQAKEAGMQSFEVKGDRLPWFCSGCPHNTSTKVPEGSRAMAGIGCHFMTVWMDRSTIGFTQMGGEGVPWVGQQPFSKEQHVFANLGDGTYFHSGILAVRQSIAAGVNITYKILYNDAVAMTGGQQVGERPEGHSVVQIAQAMRAEGAARIVVVTDEPEKYKGVQLVEGVAVHHRDELDTLQRQFREIKGTTVIIYDQTCATEKRRRRKRGTLVDPAERVVINDAVCEGCGDCSVQSNCLSVEPLETPMGRKRQINQSTCNKDFSCVKGLCPSFVSVMGGKLRKRAKAAATELPQDAIAALPEPQMPDLARPEGPWGMLVAGVGGTGVITIGQLLGVAAHLEGKGIVTQDAGGLAQKGGATWSHALIAAHQDDIATTRVGLAGADLVMACDPIVAAGRETVSRMRQGRTHVALNSTGTPTAAFVKNGQWANPSEACVASISEAVGAPQVGLVNADQLAKTVLGDTLYTNPIMLGYAWQKGWIPLSLPALMRAIELNAVQVQANKDAFSWGRLAAHEPARIAALLAPTQIVQWVPRDHGAQRQPLQDLVAHRMAHLEAYQNLAWAKRYEARIQVVAAAEQALGLTGLAHIAAEQLARLMSYKDEYEVARLQTLPAFRERLAGQFEGEYTLHYHFAPPLWAKRDAHGHLIKQRFGAWMGPVLQTLARFRGLRGTALDLFGYTEERKGERTLITQYEQTLDLIVKHLSKDNHAKAVALAQVPAGIKGFGHVKAHQLAVAQAQWGRLQAQFLPNS
jgi:indolepyruvate ferredoxin oxidoreductase